MRLRDLKRRTVQAIGSTEIVQITLSDDTLARMRVNGIKPLALNSSLTRLLRKMRALRKAEGQGTQ